MTGRQLRKRSDLDFDLNWAREERAYAEDWGTAPVVDVGLLRKAVDWVREQDALPWWDSAWAQGEWAADVSGERSCGTAYCVAGYIASMHGTVRTDGSSAVVTEDGNWAHIPTYAREKLGITERESNVLFHAANSCADIEYIASRLAGEEI